ncbi:MAG TPA: polysaccharide biosynthesis C-terminal domain-containing protein [Bacteroidales bacterium]|nr:polysaccharide biosynthesis C-terminal domain-containing protein [Bacteroidales bacterium]
MLLTNFAVVVFTTHVWGSEGRGIIAMVIADVSIITIFSNIFCGSTIAFHSPKLTRDQLFTIAAPGAILVSSAGTIVFSFISGFHYFVPLLLISLILSLKAAIISYLLGKNKINNYNTLSLAGPVLIAITIVVLYYLLGKRTVDTYFTALYLASGLVLTAATILLFIKEPFTRPVINLSHVKDVLGYGSVNELNTLLQFLNYRISYYFIIKLLGIKQLGIFSIAVAVSEAFWIISRSLSAIHFSNVINADNHETTRKDTVSYVKQSFWISLFLTVFAILVPGPVYKFIFGHDFSQTRTLILYLIPGIIAIAVSNIYDQYFSGTGKLKILTIEYSIGLILTIILLPVLITNLKLKGACISIDIAYLASSLFIFFMFRKSGSQHKTDKTGTATLQEKP